MRQVCEWLGAGSQWEDIGDGEGLGTYPIVY
jgi:hypothetical protein